jgi:hypothetical protein
MITQAQVLELYDYKDGELYWKKNTHGKRPIGSKAGGDSVNSEGRKFVSVYGKRYPASRVIFLHQNGYLPFMVDHINGIKTDNRIENLRPATYPENNRNARIRKDNSSGYKNVSWRKDRKKWIVGIRINGKRINFGFFDDLELADLVAHEARDKYHKDFARHK